MLRFRYADTSSATDVDGRIRREAPVQRIVRVRPLGALCSCCLLVEVVTCQIGIAVSDADLTMLLAYNRGGLVRTLVLLRRFCARQTCYSSSRIQLCLRFVVFPRLTCYGGLLSGRIISVLSPA